jgi:site-specific DNA recombinase
MRGSPPKNKNAKRPSPARSTSSTEAAAASGCDIAPTSEFIDDGVSGARLDRPALDRLRDLAAEGAFEVLLGTVPDRLARRYASQVLLVEEFTRCGCEVVFVQHGLDLDNHEVTRAR